VNVAASSDRVQWWTVRLVVPGVTSRWARRAEQEGWDGIAFGDSQNLAADVYVELALAARATSRVRLGTAVTNPVTRHPAITAGAIASIHGESGGRAVLGLGRGDSALAHLGLAPAPVGMFARYLERVQGYLRGDDVAFAVDEDGAGEVRSSDALGMGGQPASSRLTWLSNELDKVPVDVYCSGPRMIELAATRADRLTLAVGADVERVRWALDVARSARAAAGGGGDLGDVGVFLPVLVHPDRAKARTLIAGGVASVARFSVMHGTVTGPADDERRRQLEAIHHAYDMSRHYSHGSVQADAVSDAVIDDFAVAGPTTYCVERLQALVELGVRRIVVQAGVAGGDRAEMQAARQRLVDEVLPAVR
jgi:5,10-methylenetetrahydromethanopterin reductase